MAVMTRSVISRRARPGATPSYSPATRIGSPKRMVTLASLGMREPTGWSLSVPIRADRHDGGAGLQRELGDADLAAVEAAVARAGALGVEPERLATAEHLQGDVEGVQRGAGVVAVDRHHAESLEPGRAARGP